MPWLPNARAPSRIFNVTRGYHNETEISLITTAIIAGAMWFHHPVANAALVDFRTEHWAAAMSAPRSNFVSGGLTLGARVSGRRCQGLFLKCCDAGETGLGLTGDPTGDDEIFAESVKKNEQPDYVNLNLSGLIGYIINADVTFTLGSPQTGESWAIYGFELSGPGQSAA